MASNSQGTTPILANVTAGQLIGVNFAAAAALTHGMNRARRLHRQAKHAAPVKAAQPRVLGTTTNASQPGVENGLDGVGATTEEPALDGFSSLSALTALLRSVPATLGYVQKLRQQLAEEAATGPPSDHESAYA